MNDREMLEYLAGEFEKCPWCNCRRLLTGPHGPHCPLGKHLHPEAVEGSWQWGMAQGRSGTKVRESAWPKGRYVTFRPLPQNEPAGMWVDQSGAEVGTPHYNTDWELWEPEPEEGTAVMIKVEATE